MSGTDRVPGTVQGCLRHGYREHIVGESPNGWAIIDVVCPDCGYRLLKREVMSNPDGDRYADVGEWSVDTGTDQTENNHKSDGGSR